MKKITVYLDEREADELRQMAAQRGKPKAELVQEAIQHILKRGPQRRFHSMGAGEWDGEPVRHWTAEELYRKVFPDR